MVKVRGFEAYVVRHDDQYRYPEYTAPPGSRHYSPGANEVFIEAEDGVRFDVVAELYAKPTLKGPHISSFCAFDGRETHGYYTSASLRHASNVAPWEKTVVWDTDSRYIEGEWVACGFVFAVLDLDENADPGDDAIVRELDDQGSIRLEFKRGLATEREGRPVDHANYTTQRVESACNAVVKRGRVTHNLKYMELAPGEQMVDDVDFEPTNRAAVEITIRYRSRTALQILKIVPEDDISSTGLSTDAPILTPDLQLTTISHSPDASQVLTATIYQPEPSMSKKTEILRHETEDDDVQFVSSCEVRNAGSSTGKRAVKLEKQEAVADLPRVKRERTQDAPVVGGAAMLKSPEGTKITTSKQRKRAKLQLELEAIRVQQQLAALEDSD